MSSRRGAERRRFVRVDDDVVASVRSTGEPQERDARTLNFSAGGILFVSETTIAAGTDLAIALKLDAGKLLEFDARVIRVRSISDHAHEVAAEFVGGSAIDQRQLQQVIADRLAASPLPAPQPA